MRTESSHQEAPFFIGGRWVATWSKDQATNACSSGEAELYAANLGGTRALGLQTTLREAGWSVSIGLQVDANATNGTLHRRGLGTLRHLEVEAPVVARSHCQQED